MTMALGARCKDGVIICTDSRVVASDGLVTDGTKIMAAEAKAGAFIIANASEDGNAATSLSESLLDELSTLESATVINVQKAIRDVMSNWYKAYADSPQRPGVQMLIGVSSRMHNLLMFCEPPYTIIVKASDEVVSAGIASRVTDSLLPMFDLPRYPNGNLPSMHTCLLRLCYLMHRAKDGDTLAGGYTDCFIGMKTLNSVSLLNPSRADMADAENAVASLDKVIRWCSLRFLEEMQIEDNDDDNWIARFSVLFKKEHEAIHKIWFPSLEDLD